MKNKNFEITENYVTLTDDELMNIIGGKAGLWDGVKDGISEGADFVISLLG